jgi:hypothetical protein
VVADHHLERRTDGEWDLGELVKVSCAMASSIGFTGFPGCVTANYNGLLDELPARERTLFHPDAETLRSDVARSIHSIESV